MSRQGLVKAKRFYVATELPKIVSRQNIYFTSRQRFIGHGFFSMLRHSVLCHDSKALRCVATTLGALDRGTLSRQTSYSGKKNI